MKDPIIQVENHNPNVIVRVAQHHQHIDNGGFDFTVYVEGPNVTPTNLADPDGGYNTYIEISDGYFGYSNHSLTLNSVTPKTLREIGEMFFRAADRLDR